MATSRKRYITKRRFLPQPCKLQNLFNALKCDNCGLSDVNKTNIFKCFVLTVSVNLQQLLESINVLNIFT
jgi:hypothetical protein